MRPGNAPVTRPPETTPTPSTSTCAILEGEALGRKCADLADRLLERQSAAAHMLAHDPGEGAEASPVGPAAHIDAVGGAHIKRVSDRSLEDRLAIHRRRP